MWSSLVNNKSETKQNIWNKVVIMMIFTGTIDGVTLRWEVPYTKRTKQYNNVT